MSSQRRVPLSFLKDEVSFNTEETRLGRIELSIKKKAAKKKGNNSNTLIKNLSE